MSLMEAGATGGALWAGDELAAEPSVTVVIPTRNEGPNIVPLLQRLEKAARRTPTEVVFVDDSTDATPQVIRRAARDSDLPVRLLHRSPGESTDGLGGAVVAGLRVARAPWAVVMDGDLQHPPELVHRLVETGQDGDADLVMASRYGAGGDFSGLSSRGRVAASGAATALARCLFRRRLRAVSDPMTGFFALRLASVDLDRLRPRGFKVLLDLLVRHPALTLAEMPFTFGAREHGQSKASLREGARFMLLLAMLRMTSLQPSPALLERIGRAAGFMAVGATGVAVNSAALFALVQAGQVNYVLASFLATQVAITWNFGWTDTVVFRGAKPGGRAGRFLRFSAVSNVALLASLPMLTVFVSLLGLHYLVGNLLTLFLMFTGRFMASERLVYVRRSRGVRRRPRTSSLSARVDLRTVSPQSLNGEAVA